MDWISWVFFWPLKGSFSAVERDLVQWQKPTGALELGIVGLGYLL